jgi:hypothetical protein
MVQRALAVLALTAAVGWLGSLAWAQTAATLEAPTDQSTAIAAAAEKFLATLDDAQRKAAVFALDDAEQRKRWSNLPAGIFQRAGLRMGDLTPEQRAAAEAVLAAALSPTGYEKVMNIVTADEVLRTGGGRGRPAFGKDEYWLSFLGQPSATDAWTIQFGGHHLGINVTLAGEHGTLAPSHTGAQPGKFELEGKTVRPLGDEADKALALVKSLDEAQRAKAVLGFEMRDLTLGPGRDGQTIAPEGIQGSDLTDAQQEMLLELAGEWTGIIYDAAAEAKMAELREHVDETWFAWSGPMEQAGTAYFRIQGPTAIIEYAPQRMGGDVTNHIHTIYRDPTNEYGATWWTR